MKIACIGWGSLIWDPGDLLIIENWRNDGPVLPLEFSRISDDGRVTLIIDNNARPIKALWAYMATSEIDKAVELLRKREKTSEKNIKVALSSDVPENPIHARIIEWLQEKSLDAAVWTGLSFSKHTTCTRPSLDAIISHIESLDSDKKRRAEEYIRKAPKQIATEWRKAIEQRFDWMPYS